MVFVSVSPYSCVFGLQVNDAFLTGYTCKLNMDLETQIVLSFANLIAINRGLIGQVRLLLMPLIGLYR